MDSDIGIALVVGLVTLAIILAYWWALPLLVLLGILGIVAVGKVAMRLGGR
jgi:hypothetical protein